MVETTGEKEQIFKKKIMTKVIFLMLLNYCIIFVLFVSTYTAKLTNKLVSSLLTFFVLLQPFLFFAILFRSRENLQTLYFLSMCIFSYIVLEIYLKYKKNKKQSKIGLTFQFLEQKIEERVFSLHFFNEGLYFLFYYLNEKLEKYLKPFLKTSPINVLKIILIFPWMLFGLLLLIEVIFYKKVWLSAICFASCLAFYRLFRFCLLILKRYAYQNLRSNFISCFSDLLLELDKNAFPEIFQDPDWVPEKPLPEANYPLLGQSEANYLNMGLKNTDPRTIQRCAKGLLAIVNYSSLWYLIYCHMNYYLPKKKQQLNFFTAILMFILLMYYILSSVCLISFFFKIDLFIISLLALIITFAFALKKVDLFFVDKLIEQQLISLPNLVVSYKEFLLQNDLLSQQELNKLQYKKYTLVRPKWSEIFNKVY